VRSPAAEHSLVFSGQAIGSASARWNIKWKIVRKGKRGGNSRRPLFEDEEEFFEANGTPKHHQV
jgi:hypothetical protein